MFLGVSLLQLGRKSQMSISAIPRDVKFTERDGKTVSHGRVIKVVFVDESFPYGDFRKETQLIEWSNGSRSIRFGYYVKNHGSSMSKYQWGSQTTLILNLKNARKFLREALQLTSASLDQENRPRLTQIPQGAKKSHT